MHTFNNLQEQILQEELDLAIKKFYDYSFLLKEGRQLNEFNIGDALNKTKDLIKYATEKTGDAVGDAARAIYVKTAMPLMDKIRNLSKNESNKKRGKILTILGNIVGWMMKNPKVAFYSIRVGLLILSLIGSALGTYAVSHDENAFNNVFHMLGVDLHAQNVDQQLDSLTQLSGDELGHKIATDASQVLGPDNDYHQHLTAQDVDTVHGTQGGHANIAPTDLHDPAYKDFYELMSKLPPENVTKIENLFHLNRKLDEMQFSDGFSFSSKVNMSDSSHRNWLDVIDKNTNVTGRVKMSSDTDLFVSDVKMEHNGVVIMDVKTIHYRVDRDGSEFFITKHETSGLKTDISDRVHELAKGLNNDEMDKLFSLKSKFSDWNMSTKKYWKNESYNRMMVLAGIVSEAGMIQKGIDTVKKVVSNVTGSVSKFVQSLSNKLKNFMSSIGVVFMSPNTVEKLKDQKPHTFTIKDGKVEIS